MTHFFMILWWTTAHEGLLQFLAFPHIKADITGHYQSLMCYLQTLFCSKTSALVIKQVCLIIAYTLWDVNAPGVILRGEGSKQPYITVYLLPILHRGSVQLGQYCELGMNERL